MVKSEWEQRPAQAAFDMHCPVCGASFEDIALSGRVGCPGCYRAFFDRLQPTLVRIHGTARHCGKAPGANLPQTRPATQLSVMRSALREAISQEDFEHAAALRDRIKSLESGAGQDE